MYVNAFMSTQVPFPFLLSRFCPSDPLIPHLIPFHDENMYQIRTGNVIKK